MASFFAVNKPNGSIANLRQVCRGRIDASRAVCPLYRIIGVAATGGIYAAPTGWLIIVAAQLRDGSAFPAGL